MRLEYSAEPDPYAAAAAALDAWVADGTLERRAEPALYSYRHATASAPDEPTVEGLVVRVMLEPWGGGIRPHEHTMPGPKADRLALLGATRTQLSPILAVYFDASQPAQWLDRAPGDEWRARDDDGLIHQLRAFEPDERAARRPWLARRCSSPMDTIGTRPPWPTRPRCVPTLVGQMPAPVSWRPTGS